MSHIPHWQSIIELCPSSLNVCFEIELNILDLNMVSELRSSQAIESRNWDLKPRPSRSELLCHWVEIEPLSYNLTKPNRDHSSSKDPSQAIKPLSQDPSFSSFVAVFLFLKPNPTPSQAIPWVREGILKIITWIKEFICDLISMNQGHKVSLIYAWVYLFHSITYIKSYHSIVTT